MPSYFFPSFWYVEGKKKKGWHLQYQMLEVSVYSPQEGHAHLAARVTALQWEGGGSALYQGIHGDL